MKRRVVAFALSGLLHFALWMLLGGLPPAVRPIEHHMVELREPPPPPVPRRQQGRPHGHGRSAQSGAPVRVRTASGGGALIPSLRGSLLEKAGADSPVDEGPAFDDPRSYHLSAANYDLANSKRGFLEALYARINGVLIFNSLLAQYNHFGAVYLEFEVGPDGIVDESSIRASGQDRILKVHAIRSALLPALSRPLNENLWLSGGERLRLRTRFQFLQDKSASSLFDDNPERITGLSLTFRRFTDERPVAKTLGKHLLNGGISYDLFAMYEAWEKYQKAGERRRMEFDPFALYRADKFYN